MITSPWQNSRPLARLLPIILILYIRSHQPLSVINFESHLLHWKQTRIHFSYGDTQVAKIWIPLAFRYFVEWKPGPLDCFYDDWINVLISHCQSKSITQKGNCTKCVTKFFNIYWFRMWWSLFTKLFLLNLNLFSPVFLTHARCASQKCKQ